jgi:hypothetical protein
MQKLGKALPFLAGTYLPLAPVHALLKLRAWIGLLELTLIATSFPWLWRFTA